MPLHEGIVVPSVILLAASVLGVSTIVVAFIGCMWCRNKWKKFTQRQYFPDTFQTPIGNDQNLTEFTIFPPPSSNQFSLPSGISPDEVVFEPLPEIRSRVAASTSENIRPARFTSTCGKISLQDWFDEHQTNFPRHDLKYFKEVGPTWYGQAVKGEAYSIKKSEEKTQVVVKILRVDATSTELMQFLQETRPFRDLCHPNLLTLLNRCLEVHPFLLIMEHCPIDLKAYLIEQRKTPEILLQNGHLLRMACSVISAIQHMHEHSFLHMDLAAHSCLVSSNGVVKLGDYGTAVHLHKSDYYCLGDVAFPIRWCAPESLMCTESVLEAKDITREANIWSFGVFLWELLEFGKLPYVNFNDNDVIQKLFIENTLKLEQPKTPCTHKDIIFKIMQLCWSPPHLRPPATKIHHLLTYLQDTPATPDTTGGFEMRWSAMQQPSRDHNLQQHYNNNTPLKFESDFMPGDVRSLDCDSLMSTELFGDKSPTSSVSISPSMLNLRGSVEDLIDQVESTTNGSTSEPLSLDTLPAGSEISDSDAFQMRISEAIHDLDDILANEAESSDPSHCNTPDIRSSEDEPRDSSQRSQDPANIQAAVDKRLNNIHSDVRFGNLNSSAAAEAFDNNRVDATSEELIANLAANVETFNNNSSAAASSPANLATVTETLNNYDYSNTRSGDLVKSQDAIVGNISGSQNAVQDFMNTHANNSAIENSHSGSPNEVDDSSFLQAAGNGKTTDVKHQENERRDSNS